jgi:hypothetical protein
MMCVPHPEGKTDRKGEVLPVFRNTERTGVVINGPNGSRREAYIRPDGYKTLPKNMPSYYDKMVLLENLTKI